jgi:hypothetical protein
MGVRVTADLDTLHSLAIKADAGVEREPDITFDGNNYIVVWSEGVFASMHKVRATRVTAQGAVLDSGIPFGKDSYLEYRPSIAFDGARCLAVWYNYTTPLGVFGRFLNDQAQPDGDAFEITVSSNIHLYQPDIAFAGDRYLVVWNEQTPYTGDDIFGQIIDPFGTLHGNVIPIGVGPGYESNPRVAGGAAFLVVWDQNGKIMGQRISAQGQLVGVNFEISDTSSNDRLSADIAAGTENYLAAWMQYNNNSYDIFGNLDVALGINRVREDRITPDHLEATIVKGSLARYLVGESTLYDVTGRRIDHESITTGIYFLKKGGKITTKIIKVH